MEALRRAGLRGAELQQALDPPAVKVVTSEPIDPERDRKGGFAFVAVLILYTQLLTYGYLLASGVVEEKASRVVEVLLSTIRPKDLLAGKANEALVYQMRANRSKRQQSIYTIFAR